MIMKQILFSGAGLSDPCNNYHDGAVLHILRYYPCIDEVFLFLTKDIWEKNKQTGAFEYAFDNFQKRMKRKLKIHYIKSDIEKVDDYNYFYDIFIENIKKIKRDNPVVEILLNIS